MPLSVKQELAEIVSCDGPESDPCLQIFSIVPAVRILFYLFVWLEEPHLGR